MRSEQKNAFTLIELLVVISIIALLLAILMPALSKARYMTKRLICLTRVRDQATSLFTYASANDGKFPDNNSNGPQYQRSPVTFGSAPLNRVFGQMYGSYIINTEVMFCPLIKKLGGSCDKRNYTSAGGGYAGWDIMEWSGISAQGDNWDPSGGPPAFISSGYCWFVNFRQHPDADKVVFSKGETPWPKNMETCSSRSAIITHEVSGDSTSLLYWDFSHGGLGDGSWGLPIEDMGTEDSPVGCGDGSVIFHKKNEMMPRGSAAWGGGVYWYYY